MHTSEFYQEKWGQAPLRSTLLYRSRSHSDRSRQEPRENKSQGPEPGKTTFIESHFESRNASGNKYFESQAPVGEIWRYLTSLKFHCKAPARPQMGANVAVGPGAAFPNA